MNPKLQAAVAIFKELGWENVTPENVLQLPLGTAEQKRTALEGLKSGEWQERDEWKSYVDVEEFKLALFAVRVGVTAQRAVNIVENKGKEMLIAAITERGANYAQDFIRHACVSSRRLGEHTASAFGSVAVQLVDGLNLDTPQSVEYMKDWSVYAAAAMGLKAETLFKETGLLGVGSIERRFAEHIQTGVAVGVPATGPFGSVLPEGVKRGWFPRDKAVPMAFSALDASVRPGDRRAWLSVLDKLGITDDELSERAQSLVPLLASGDAVVVSRLAPPLISKAEGPLLTELLLASFSVTTKSARLLVLKAAQGRPCPANTEELAPWLSLLAGDRDKAVAAQAAKLIQQWGLGIEKMPDEATGAQGLWRETPPLWKPPPFELGDVTSERLTELAARLMNQPEVIHDVTAELFLALANALAFKNAEAARTALRGLRQGSPHLLRCVLAWVKETHIAEATDQVIQGVNQGVFLARDYVVSRHLGKLPCLLSTPSRVDLSIGVADLAARLALYKETGTEALEADLLLALTRIDPATVTRQAIDELLALEVPVILPSGKKKPVTAGRAAKAYFDYPVREPKMQPGKNGHWDQAKIEMPQSMRVFSNLFQENGYEYELFSIFPHWGDYALGGVGKGDDSYHAKGLLLRQVARRAAPLPPGAAMNILGAMRSHMPRAAEDSMLAVTEAWERGLLRPNVADVAWLDWKPMPPSRLGALAAALDGLAREGLLSVVWPVLDVLIQESLRAPRLLAGTAELAELALAFLPETQTAVEGGLADKTALDLPGLRALSQLGGSSKAVMAAKAIAAQLPSIKSAPAEHRKTAPTQEQPFETVWPAPKTGAPLIGLIEDGVAVDVSLAYQDSPRICFLFTLKLPNVSDRVFQVVKPSLNYDLQTEGQCEAFAVAPDATAFIGFEEGDDCEVYLRWDVEKGRVVATNEGKWIEGEDGSLNDGLMPPPLPISLLTVAIGLLAQDGDATSVLKELIEKGQIHPEIVRRATRTLLKHQVVNPARLLRPLEKDIKLLPTLWPMLTESIKAAGVAAKAGENQPAWVNRILDAALHYAPYLAEAAKRGLIPEDDAKWHGLSEIASSKAKSTAAAKAKKLLEIVG